MSNRLLKRPTLSSELGYTLFELLVAVTIIGVLSAIAIPTYTRYQIKAKINTLWNEVGAAKLAIEHDYNQFSSLNNSNYENNTVEFTTSKTNYVDSIKIINGTITITGKNTAFSGKNIYLIFTPRITENQIDWGCTSSNDASSFVSDYCKAIVCPAYTEWANAGQVASFGNTYTGQVAVGDIRSLWEQSCNTNANSSLCQECFFYQGSSATERRYLDISTSYSNGNTNATLTCNRENRSLLPGC